MVIEMIALIYEVVQEMSGWANLTTKQTGMTDRVSSGLKGSSTSIILKAVNFKHGPLQSRPAT
jgi:hypothetical protein